MYREDIIKILRTMFNNVQRDDDSLYMLVNEVSIDIQEQSHLFKHQTEFDLIGEERDKQGNITQEAIYNYNVFDILDTDVSTTYTADTKASDNDQEPEQSTVTTVVGSKYAGALSVLEILTDDYGTLPLSVLENDILYLDEYFDFKTYNKAIVYGSVNIFDLESLDQKQFMKIKNALYWGTLDKLHTSVSSNANFQMENLYYQRYYSAIQELIKNNGGLTSRREYNRKINQFV